jgi:hypothetical protein
MKPESPLDELVQPFGFSSYAVYIQSARWKSFKEKYKNSQRPQHCIECGGTPFQLHHITYVRVCQEDLDDVVPLCGFCHMAEHKIKRRRVRGEKVRPKVCRKKPSKKKEKKRLKQSEIVPSEIRKFIESGCGIDTLKKLFPHVSGKSIELTFTQLYWLRPKPPEPILIVKPKIDKSKICHKCKEEKYPTRICKCIEKKIKNCIKCWAKLPSCLMFDKCKSCRSKED